MKYTISNACMHPFLPRDHAAVLNNNMTKTEHNLQPDGIMSSHIIGGMFLSSVEHPYLLEFLFLEDGFTGDMSVVG